MNSRNQNPLQKSTMHDVRARSLSHLHCWAETKCTAACPFDVGCSWRISIVALGLINVAALTGCTPSTSVAPPTGWVQVDAKKFTFYVPPDVKAKPVIGIDSFVGDYMGDAISLSFDYGLYSDPLDYSGKTNFVQSAERIDGKKARLVSYHDPGSGDPFDEAIAVHFPDVGPKGIKLTVYASCRTEKEYDTVRTIFRTIRFR